MKETAAAPLSEKEWVELFQDPGAALSTLERNVEGKASLSLRLALWFEYFLQKGADEVKSRLSLLSQEELIALTLPWLQCFLSQPLYLRIYRGESPEPFQAPLNFSPWGRLYLVEQGTGERRRREVLYPLEHKRLWPEALYLLPEKIVSSSSVIQALSPAISLAASSRLEKIRKRAEILAALFRRGKGEEEGGSVSPRIPPPEEQGEVQAAEEGAWKKKGKEGVPTGRKKRTRKPGAEQLVLFAQEE